MSGLPIDVVDSRAGSLYGLQNLGAAVARARPNFVRGVDPYKDMPPGDYFNPFAFAEPVVQAGQTIPSLGGTGFAGAVGGTGDGDVGRNILRMPRQTNVDFSIFKRFRIDETKKLEFRAEFYNLLNVVNLAKPVSDLGAVDPKSVDSKSGQVFDPGDFGRIHSVSNNPRLIQLVLKLNF